MAHGIVNTDNLSGTFDGTKVVAVRFYSGTTPTVCDNGSIVYLDSKLPDGTWKATVPTANTLVLGRLAIVAGEILPTDGYDIEKSEWENAAGASARAYILEKGDTFSLSADNFTGGTACDATTNVGVKIPAATTWTACEANDSYIAAKFVESWINADGVTMYRLRMI